MRNIYIEYIHNSADKHKVMMECFLIQYVLKKTLKRNKNRIQKSGGMFKVSKHLLPHLTS